MPICDVFDNIYIAANKPATLWCAEVDGER